MAISRKKTMLKIALVVFFLSFDRLFKAYALSEKGQGKKIIGEWLRWNYVPNKNIAFSLPFFNQQALVIVNSLIIVFLIYLMLLRWKDKGISEFLFFFLIVCGAISNLYDRIKFGFVIDYFDLQYFTVFNIADALITVGAAGLIYLSIIKKKSLS